MTADERLEAVERERAQDLAKAHEALAAAQDRSYWLDRWGLDLNALMRKPGAGLIRAGLRAVRAAYRLAYDARNRTGAAVDVARDRVGAARTKLDRERSDAAGAAAPVALADVAIDAADLPDRAAVQRRLAELHATLDPGAALVLAAQGAAEWIDASAWSVALHLPGGLDGDRDLYVLERK